MSNVKKWFNLGRVKDRKAGGSYIELDPKGKDTTEGVRELLSRLEDGQKVFLNLQVPDRDGQFAEPKFVRFKISLPPAKD